MANARLVSENLGCEALSECAILLVDTVMRELGREYELFLPDSGYHDKAVKVLEIGGRKIEYRVCTYPYSVAFPRTLRVIARNLLMRWPNEFRKARLVFNLGQGDSFSDIYGKRRFRQTDLCNRLAAAHKLPFIFLPQTIGPFEDPDISVQAGRSLGAAEYVMCRDASSLDCCRQLAPASSCGEFIDMAFLLPYEKVQLPQGGIHVGLNVSALLWNGGYDARNQFGLKCDYRALVRAIIEYFKGIDGVCLHLVPHVIVPGNEIENDAVLCKALQSEFSCPNVVAAPAFSSASQAKSYIAATDFFMGARMHSTIAAFSAGVPVVPMSYSRKFTGMFGQSLQYPHVLDMNRLDMEAAMNHITDCFSRRQELKSLESDILSTVVDARLAAMKDTLKTIISEI